MKKTYARINERGEIVQSPVDLRTEFPNTSFPENPAPADLPEGIIEVPEAPAPEPAVDPVTSLSEAIQRHLDATAQSWGYDHILSACSYAAGAHPKFSSEGRAFLAWRESVWAAAYAYMDAIKSGTRPVPTEMELMEALPRFTLSP